MWTDKGAMVIEIPHGNFNARGILWDIVGKSFVLFGKDKCCVAYVENTPKSLQDKENNPKAINQQLKNLNIIN